MKKLIVTLVLALVLAVYANGLAHEYNGVPAVIDAKTSDRVHLREKPSANSNSYGLYFTGTEVMCGPDVSGEWIWVNVGTEAGYIKAEYLHLENDPGSVTPQQPTGTVNNKNGTGRVNLRYGPSTNADVAGQYANGDTVTILGETKTHWYYVKTDNQYGYMKADYVAMGKAAASGNPSSSSSPSYPSYPSEEYQMMFYTDAPNAKSSVSIQYPWFTDAGLAQLNGLIYQKVRGMVQSSLDSYDSGTGVTIDYQAAVTLQNSKIVSVIFWGSSYVEGGLHPFTDLVAYNVDLMTWNELRLADLYVVDASFEKVFFEKAYFPTNPVTSYDAASFSEMLKLQTPEYQMMSPFSAPENVSCFLKPDGLVLSMSAVHATGSDHFEAQLRYGDIQKFYRPTRNYWEQ